MPVAKHTINYTEFGQRLVHAVYRLIYYIFDRL